MSYFFVYAVRITRNLSRFMVELFFYLLIICLASNLKFPKAVQRDFRFVIVQKNKVGHSFSPKQITFLSSAARIYTTSIRTLKNCMYHIFFAPLQDQRLWKI
jgi:hypothetical protein